MAIDVRWKNVTPDALDLELLDAGPAVRRDALVSLDLVSSPKRQGPSFLDAPGATAELVRALDAFISRFLTKAEPRQIEPAIAIRKRLAERAR